MGLWDFGLDKVEVELAPGLGGMGGKLGRANTLYGGRGMRG